MALLQRLLPTDDGISKRSDSPRSMPSNSPKMRPLWTGIRRRRTLLALGILILVYVFIHNFPSDVAPVSTRYNPVYGQMASGHTKSQLQAISNQGHTHDQKESYTGKLHDEPVRFVHLASTLRLFANERFGNTVLFVLLYPSSVAHLLPLACQMSSGGLNAVHVALLGRSEVLPLDIMKVNGILPEDCPIQWHDARTDFAMASTERRILASIKQGYSYLHRALTPSIVLTDDVLIADKSHLKLLETSVQKSGAPLLRLPPTTLQSMPWITLLEGSSLVQLANIEIEIVVQAYSESSGSLIKLLRSLKQANYAGLNIPRLTIDLPHDTDLATTKFLSRFTWPPATANKAGQFTVRKRLDPRHLSPAEAALMSVESFYPARNSANTHVLMLSPDMELSTGYLHYIMFTILHFRHSQSSYPHGTRLFGISLHLPEAKLDGTTPFLPTSELGNGPFTLSQTPNGGAALYFGDQWMELHSFLAKQLETDPQLTKSGLQDTLSTLPDYPHWTRCALELMQVLGSYMLYPAFASDPKEQVVFLHRELRHTPEDFTDADTEDTLSTSAANGAWLSGNKILGEELGPQETYRLPTQSPATTFLPTILRANNTQGTTDRMFSLSAMRLHSATGELVEWFDLDDIASQRADEFSIEVGGCKSLKSRDGRKIGTVDYLFCDSAR